MAHFIGKIDLNRLIGVRMIDAEIDGEEKKGLFIPIKDNDIIQWKDEWQLWFRAMHYRMPTGRFTHFIMKFIPRSQIKKMSQAQIDFFANHAIGGMIKTGNDTDEKEICENKISQVE